MIFATAASVAGREEMKEFYEGVLERFYRLKVANWVLHLGPICVQLWFLLYENHTVFAVP